MHGSCTFSGPRPSVTTRHPRAGGSKRAAGCELRLSPTRQQVASQILPSSLELCSSPTHIRKQVRKSQAQLDVSPSMMGRRPSIRPALSSSQAEFKPRRRMSASTIGQNPRESNFSHQDSAGRIFMISRHGCVQRTNAMCSERPGTKGQLGRFFGRSVKLPP
jgi:hypothetical protein